MNTVTVKKNSFVLFRNPNQNESNNKPHYTGFINMTSDDIVDGNMHELKKAGKIFEIAMYQNKSKAGQVYFKGNYKKAFFPETPYSQSHRPNPAPQQPEISQNHQENINRIKSMMGDSGFDDMVVSSRKRADDMYHAEDDIPF